MYPLRQANTPLLYFARHSSRMLGSSQLRMDTRGDWDNMPPRWTGAAEVQDLKQPFLPGRPAHFVHATPVSYDRSQLFASILTRLIDGPFYLDQHCLLTMRPALTRR